MSAAPARPRRRHARGYTMIEVMTALAVLALGAFGVIAIQRATIIGNQNAKNLAMANTIAMTWAERLRTDAMVWNASNGKNDLNETLWLQAPPTTPGPWTVPATVAGVGSPAADALGTDIFAADKNLTQAYCTHIRLTLLYPTMIRAEIRTFWKRNYSPMTCTETSPQVEAKFKSGDYGFVFITTGIPQNTAAF